MILKFDDIKYPTYSHKICYLYWNYKPLGRTYIGIIKSINIPLNQIAGQVTEAYYENKDDIAIKYYVVGKVLTFSIDECVFCDSIADLNKLKVFK